MKKGDIVKCIFADTIGSRKLTKDKYYEVFDNLETLTYDEVLIKDDYGNSMWLDAKRFRKDMKEKFKEGDKVVCLVGTTYSTQLIKGNTYTIVNTNITFDEVQVKDEFGGDTWWNDYRFELKKEKEHKDMKEKFKEGDIIRCIYRTDYTERLTKDTTYRVIDYKKESCEVRLVDNGGDLTWWSDYRFELKKEKECKDMTKEEKYMKLQDMFVELNDLKVGDMITITHKAHSEQNGWRCCWHEGLDKFIGKSAIVKEIGRFGITCDNTYSFPFFVVEKIDYKLPEKMLLPSGDYYAEFLSKGDIKVGCQSIDYTTLATIYDTATEVRKKTT